MARYDLDLEELRRYAPALDEPSDLDAFWAETLAETAAAELRPELQPVSHGLAAVQTFDASWNGFGGHRVRGWLHMPAAPLRRSPLPAVVQFQGYNGGRGLPWEHVVWATAGYAHLVVDTRGQGSGWTVGATADPVGSGPAQPGFLTRGLEDPGAYYYRRVYADAVRALEMVATVDGVDRSRIAVAGHSQGGGIALAVAALAKGVAALMCDVPFLCHIQRGAEISPADPYGELVRYLAAHRDRQARVFATLGYFDGAVLAGRATAPALFSVALMDEICPPSTVYAAFNRYAGQKEIVVYPWNGHEGGEALHRGRQFSWLATTFDGSADGVPA